MKRAPVILVLTAATIASMAAPAAAHTGAGILGAFSSGFTHPVFGIDHLLAMLAVGMWGAQLGGRAIWVLPVAFPMVMALGGSLGVLGIPVPAVEYGIAGSVIVLGAAVALAARPPVWAGATIVGALALFHGHAHGTELPVSADPLAYGLGFVIGTGMIHAAGIGLGTLTFLPRGVAALRVAGGAICAAGLYFFTAPLMA